MEWLLLISTLEMTLAVLAIILLLENTIFITVAVMKGKKLSNYLRQRYPSQWEEMGKPQPAYFNILQRQEWSIFLNNKKYLEFNDTRVTELGNAQRSLEKIMFINLIVTFAIFGGIVFWDQFLR